MAIFPWFKSKPKLTDGAFWTGWFGGNTWTGKPVTVDGVLQLSTAFACIRLTAQAISTLGISVYEKEKDGGRKVITDTPLSLVLQESPNDDQTPAEFWEAIIAWSLVNGNGYAEKGFIGERLVSLTGMPADRTIPYRNDVGVLAYKLNDRGKVEILPREKVFHLRGFSFGGDVAPSIIHYGAQTFSTARATEEAGAKIFANGLQTAGMLTSEKVLSDPQREALRKILEGYSGSENAGKLLVLEAGLKYESISMNFEDAEMLQTRRFHVEEICRWFGIPPIIIGHAAEGQTMFGSGVEQTLIAWLTLGLNPIIRRIEQKIKKELASVNEKGRSIYAEFNREALLQADSAAKAEFLTKLTSGGLMTRNEGRAKLNLPRMPGADQLTVQMQMQPIQATGVPLQAITETAK